MATTEIEFSFNALPVPARRHIRVFQRHQFLDRCAMGLTVAVVALALSDRGMDLFQISLLFGIYAITTLLMELPFGGLADNIGRKPVFLAAVVASLVSLLLFLSSSDFVVLAFSFGFIGFGRALRSGTLDAWFVEGFKARAPDVDIQPALAKAQWAGAMGLASGAVLGGVLPDVFGAVAQGSGLGVYDVSYVASFGMMSGVFVYTVFAIHEAPRPLNVAALGQGFAGVPSVIRASALLALRHPTLSVLLGALALFLMASNPVEVLWPTHARPMLEVGYANTVIGAVTAVYFFAIAFGASLSPLLSRLLGRRHAVTLGVVFAALAVIQVALALPEGIGGFVAVFILYSVAIGVSETPASSLLHGSVQDHQRSTMLSLRSLVQQLGAALGLVMAGALAQAYSAAAAWMAAALLLVVASGLCVILARRLAVTGG